jgi:hypothetical protein
MTCPTTNRTSILSQKPSQESKHYHRLSLAYSAEAFKTKKVFSNIYNKDGFPELSVSVTS